jgi:DNA-binding response OmpR family regulator
MALTALIVSPQPLDAELADTVLWRKNVERYAASSAAEVRRLASSGRPDIIVLDKRLANAAGVVAELRRDPLTRTVSIVVLARGDCDPSEIAFLEAGANAILRLPPGPDWDDRLVRLIHVPLRRATRFEVNVRIESGFAVAGEALPVTALNLSVTGMLLESPHPLHVGDDVRFAFSLPGDSEVISGTGMVVRQASSANQFGVELTQVEGDGRLRIKRFVESDRS